MALTVVEFEGNAQRSIGQSFLQHHMLHRTPRPVLEPRPGAEVHLPIPLHRTRAAAGGIHSPGGLALGGWRNVLGRRFLLSTLVLFVPLVPGGFGPDAGLTQSAEPKTAIECPPQYLDPGDG